MLKQEANRNNNFKFKRSSSNRPGVDLSACLSFDVTFSTSGTRAPHGTTLSEKHDHRASVEISRGGKCRESEFPRALRARKSGVILPLLSFLFPSVPQLALSMSCIVAADSITSSLPSSTMSLCAQPASPATDVRRWARHLTWALASTILPVRGVRPRRVVGCLHKRARRTCRFGDEKRERCVLSSCKHISCVLRWSPC
jgi:hypothetical protein